MNTARVSFQQLLRQKTEMFQWPKCLSEKNPGLYNYDMYYKRFSCSPAKRL